MGFIDDLSEFMVHSVTWRPLSTRDDFGVPTYTTPGTTFSARIVRKHKLVRDAAGDQVVSSAHAWLQGSPAIAPDDQVELSDDSSTPPIITVERYPDEDGEEFTKVFFR